MYVSQYRGICVTGTLANVRLTYAAPSGYKALCDTNLPSATIKDGSKHFDVVTYTGNGSTQTISGLGFSPDLVWIKCRDIDYSHNFYVMSHTWPYKCTYNKQHRWEEAAETRYGYLYFI